MESLEAFPKLKCKSEILDLKFHPSENNLILLGLINGRLKIYDLSKEEERLVASKKLHKKSLRRMSFPTENSNQIFTASKDKSIKLTDLQTDQNILHLEKAHQAPINCLKVVDNWLIASGDDDGCVKIWDYRRKTATMESKEDCSDYISDLAVSKDKKILLATCGEGTLNTFHLKKEEAYNAIGANGLGIAERCFHEIIAGTGEGVINIFNYDEWSNISDRFPGHPSSIDCLLPISRDVVLTGCFDGQIRACSILPNRFLGVVGSHDDFPVQNLCLSSDGNVCASSSHDSFVKFWNIENIKAIKIDAQSKTKKGLKNRKMTVSGKAENFFADLDESKGEDGSSDDEDSDDDEEEEEEGGENEDENEENDDASEDASENDDSSDSEDEEKTSKRKKIKTK